MTHSIFNGNISGLDRW